MAFSGADFVVSAKPAAPTALGLVAKKAVNNAAHKSKNIRELAALTQRLMEAANGSGWHVAVGTDFAVDLRYRKGACLLLSSRSTNIRVLLYRTTPALSPLPLSDHEALATPPTPLPTGRKQQQLKQRVTIHASDMDDAMQVRTVDATKQLLEHFVREDKDDATSKVAAALKHSLTFAYGHTWHVLVASSRELCVEPHVVAGTHCDFSIDQFRVVVYQHATAALDAQRDVTLLGNRAALLLALVSLLVYAYIVFTSTDADEQCVQVTDPQDGSKRIAVGCSLTAIVRANARKAWKGMALFSTMLFTVVATGLRMYRSTLRQKIKQV